MGRKVGGGASLGDHYAALAKKGYVRKDLDPEMPEELGYLWNVFVKLGRTRGSGGFGPAPITFSEMRAYCQMTGDDLLPWEVEVIRDLDDAYLTSLAQGA